MEKEKIERIVKTYYDKLEEGAILGRKCKSCGHVEYPPYLICNTCGGIETEWVEMSGKAMCTQILPPAAAFPAPDLTAMVGDYWVAAVKPEESDEISTCLVHIDPSRYDEIRAKLPVPVKPVILQDEDVKFVMWELDE